MASSHSALPLPTYFQSMSVLLLIRILFLAGGHSLNQSSDAVALLRLKADNFRMIWYGGPGWVNWHATDENPCAWNGVTCTNNSTVLALDLSNWASDQSFGYIDVSALSDLPDLRQLDLSHNLLYDLAGITSLQGLVRVDLSFNLFHNFPGYSYGSEPIGICNMSKLAGFDISSNFIAGPLPACFFGNRRLQYLSFQQNNFSGEVPSLGALVNLQFLYLADNQLSGPFPIGLSGLSNILMVDLSNNLLSGTIPAFSNATNLVQLKLDNNSLTGFDEPWFVGANSSLSTLSISYNQLTGVIPSGILDMLSLRYLNISSNQLTGPVPMGFGSLPLLLSLDLSHNLLVGKIPSDVLSLWAVGYDSGSGLDNCVDLNFSHNLLNDTIPDYDGLQCFGNLDLSYNDLSGAIPSNFFSNSASIHSLSFQNNRLSGDVIDRLDENNGHVVFVYLQNNLLTGDLTRLANGALNNSLGYIDLTNNSLGWSTSEAIPDPISSTLENWGNGEFHLGGNDFSGTPVPTTCLGSPFWRVRVLDLSNSHLKGEILGSAFNSSCFPSLSVLNLSGNDITGSVPEDIFMPNLQVLDLSNNKLSGPLPTIPPNSIFHNPDMFSGNVGLCGYPLDTCPQANPPQVVFGATGVRWWELFLIIGGALIIATGSCLAATWRWRVYQRRHQQDADLINTLLERDSATLMSLRELKKATDNFAASAQIGEGGFGTVYAGTLNDGTMVAIKRSKREGLDRDKQQFLNEVRILSQVSHRNLVKLLGCCMENKTAVLVFEFVSNGTLQEHLHGKFGSNHLTWEQRLNIALQTANALMYLHTATTFPVYHRDVKSANILLDEQLNAKVADFGISKLAPLQVTHVSTAAIQGTMGYIDPEYYTSYRLSDKSDVFSFGVVLLELISSKLPLDLSRNGDDSSLVNLASPLITRGELQDLIDPALLETYNEPGGLVRESILKVGRLALKCVNLRSRSRPTMNEVWKVLEILWLELTSTRNLGACEVISDDDVDHSKEFQTFWGEISGEMSDRKKGNYSYSMKKDLYL